MIEIKKLFSKNNKNVSEITMSNGLIEIKALTLGATITSFKLLSDPLNVVCAYQNKEDYSTNPYYLGATIGPLAGRTKNGQFEVDGHPYQVDTNDKTNHLHGGKTGLHLVNMDFLYEDDDRFPSLVFMKEVNHKRGGYPGKIKYLITYKLAGHKLMVNHKAFPEFKCPISMTNHMYFNLGKESTILDHVLSISSSEIMKLDESYCPTDEIIRVQNTAFDFRVGHLIKDRLKKHHPQFEMTHGLDHPFIFGDKHHVTLFAPSTKLSLNMTTNAEAVVVYTANFFEKGFMNQRNELAENYSAIAIEPTQKPNGANLKNNEQYFFTKDHPYDVSMHYVLSKTM